MKHKTAVQQLYEAIHSPSMSLVDAWEWLMNNEQQLLETERQQIIDARLYVTGLNHASPVDDENLTKAEQYYNETYQ